MSKEKVYSKFKSLRNVYQKAVIEISQTKRNDMYSENYKDEVIKGIRNSFFEDYRKMKDAAIKEADFLIRDKKAGWLACNVNKQSADEKLYNLQLFSNVIDKMEVSDILEYYKKEDVLKNETLREMFLIKADSYKNKVPAMSGLNEKIDELVATINLDNLSEVVEYNKLINEIENYYSMGINWNSIPLDMADGNFETTHTVDLGIDPTANGSFTYRRTSLE